MFSGIVEATGVVRRTGTVVAIAAAAVARGTRRGDSIAVSGVCLTVAARRGGTLGFHVVPETLRRSTLGRLTVGQRVNLERSLRVGDRISGHFVAGHVDGIGVVTERRAVGGDVRLTIRLPESVDPRAVVPKGSLAVDGVSLTVGEVGPTTCTVYLIPETMRRTTLGALRTGDRVNLEVDLLSRYVQSWLSRRRGASRITEAFLKKHGFA